MTPQEQALEALERLSSFTENYGAFQKGGWQNDIDEQTIRQALQSQAENERVMKLLAEAIKAARAQTPYHGKLNSMAHELYDKALSEYQKLEVNND